MKDKQKIINHAIRNFIVNDFEETMINSIMKVMNVNRAEAEYKTEKNLKSLWNLFTNKVDEHKKTNMYPYINIIDKTTRRFSDYTKISGYEKRSEKLKKLKLQRRLQIYEYLETINWREYEALGCIIMKLLGAKEDKIHLTESKNEEGVDFLSIVPAYGKHHIIPNISKKLKIIGQSKKWEYPIPKERISLLNDTIENFKRRRIEFLTKFPSWIFSDSSVYQGIVFSHSGYQRGAKDFARDYGIILADTFDMTEIISLSSDVGSNTEKIIKYLYEEIKKTLNN